MSQRVTYTKCRCGQSIVVLNTQRGKKIAVNDEPRGHEAWRYMPVARQETMYQYGIHQPHVATCMKPKMRPERKRYV